MTDKVKEVKDEEASPQAEEKKTETSPEAAQETKESESPEDKVVNPEGDVDYKGELEKARKTIAKQERVIVKHKIGEKKEKPKAPKIDKEKIKKEVTADIRRDMAEEFIDETLNSISSNPDERELIKHHYKNTINPTGTSRSAVFKDLARAKMIANESKIMRENKELKTALSSRNAMPNISQGTNQEQTEIDETDKYLSKDTLTFLERQAGGDPEKLEKLKKDTIASIKTRPIH